MPEVQPLIIIVDDDVDFLDIYRRILTREGYRTVCCTGPDEALRRMAAEAPSLIITDLMMDSLASGFTFAKAVKVDPKYAHIPVIVATAAGSQRGYDFRPLTEEELRGMCADAFFDKPVNMKRLLSTVSLLLGGWRREGETSGGPA